MKEHLPTRADWAGGLTLVEILIAIGIMGIAMMLIAAAFPAGVAMSVAVSEETTSEMVFQQALGVIREKYSATKIDAYTRDPGNDQPRPLPRLDNYDQLPDLYLGLNKQNTWLTTESFRSAGEANGRDNRIYRFDGTTASAFSWSAIIRRMGNSGPMGNLFHVVVVVSRRPARVSSFVPNFPDDAETMGIRSGIPELRWVWCVGSDAGARTLTVHSGDRHLLTSNGYIIDEETGQVYLITGVDDEQITVLSEPPEYGEISSTDPRVFWVVPGPYDDSRSRYGRHSPAVGVFEAMLYLP